MAVAISLAFSIIPILIALYAVRGSLPAEKYAPTQVKLVEEQERKREREQATHDNWDFVRRFQQSREQNVSAVTGQVPRP